MANVPRIPYEYRPGAADSVAAFPRLFIDGPLAVQTYSAYGQGLVNSGRSGSVPAAAPAHKGTHRENASSRCCFLVVGHYRKVMEVVGYERGNSRRRTRLSSCGR